MGGISRERQRALFLPISTGGVCNSGSGSHQDGRNCSVLAVLGWKDMAVIQIRFICKNFLDLEMFAVLIGDMMCPDARTRNNRHCGWTHTVGSSLDP
jgi:hypothetical protein